MRGSGRGRCYGAITIVSALATGKGCALGVDLPVTAEVRLEEGKFRKKDFVDLCVAEVFSHYSVEYMPRVTIASAIPPSRGLKSSSAVANAVIMATAYALGERLESEEILRMNVAASRKAGVSITGALDDAAASLFGGLVFTDNREDILLKREPFPPDYICVLFIPKEECPTRSFLPRLEFIRKFSQIMDFVYSLADQGNIFEAMTLNGLVYSPLLGFSTDLMLMAMAAGADASSLSGTGSAVAALVSNRHVDEVILAWGKGMKVNIRRGVE
ncbi:MAG: shikimate kinase [Theionarchaea archaeon]|nr:shikimate kinase [Theionarchaea archaeon]